MLAHLRRPSRLLAGEDPSLAAAATVIKLRPYQIDAIEAWNRYTENGGRRGLMVLPTAAGKTVIFAQLPKTWGRTLVLAHREELLDQAAEKLAAANPELTVGIEAAARRAGDADLVVGSVPTLGRNGSKRLDDIGDFELLIVDEAHHASPDNLTYQRVLDHFAEVPRLGVTATPQRGDRKGLIGVFDDVVYFRTIEEMIREGWLVPPAGYRVRTGSDLSGVKTRAGEFVESELAAAVDNDDRNRLAVEAYISLAVGRRACVYCVNIEHAEHMEETFRKAGFSVTSVFGHTPKDERKERLADFARGRYSVMVSVGVLTEGWDDPGVSCLIMARPTRSPLLFTQIIGRGLRLHPGKDDCLIIDLADACVGKKPVGLPTLMGLPPDFDSKGQKLHEVAERFRELETLSPEEAARVKDVKELESAFERIDLFRPAPMDPFMADITQFTWMELGEGHWVLNLSGPESEKLDIRVDAIGRYTVSLRGRTGGRVLGTADDMMTAFAKTDAWVRAKRQDRITLLDRDAMWRNTPPTEKQLKWLRRFKVPVTKEMTKGQASLILDRLFTTRPKKSHRP